jgi:hypothetical protein
MWQYCPNLLDIAYKRRFSKAKERRREEEKRRRGEER